MVSKSTIIRNKNGLHARPAANFTRTATGFTSDITLINDENQEGNAKSIISVLSMRFVQGSTIEIRAEGEDEASAVDTLIQLIDAAGDEK